MKKLSLETKLKNAFEIYALKAAFKKMKELPLETKLKNAFEIYAFCESDDLDPDPDDPNINFELSYTRKRWYITFLYGAVEHKTVHGKTLKQVITNLCKKIKKLYT